jgi:ABC-type Fe3+ transport system permease subunit
MRDVANLISRQHPALDEIGEHRLRLLSLTAKQILVIVGGLGVATGYALTAGRKPVPLPLSPQAAGTAQSGWVALIRAGLELRAPHLKPKTAAGLAALEAPYRDLGRLLRLSPWQHFRRIELPFALPPIFAGLRIASTQAVTAAVIGELMGATFGLGYLLSLGQENGDAAVVIVAVLILSTIGWGFHEVIRLAERRLLAWHESQATLRIAEA